MNGNRSLQYDGFGNLTAKILNGTSTPIQVDATTNRLVYASYDANGNMTSGAGATFTYDEANRVTTVTETSGGEAFYGYDASNRRIYERGALMNPFNNSNEAFTFYGAKGENLGRYSIIFSASNQANCPTNYVFCLQPWLTNLWFGGRLVAQSGVGTTPRPVYQDRLGTNRETGNYYPFGDGGAGTDTFQFATYTRDSYSGLDYADQRFYASTYGRFLTADPYSSSGRTTDPVSWNRYSYVGGDPVNRADPRGLDWSYVSPPMPPTFDPTWLYGPSGQGQGEDEGNLYLDREIGYAGAAGSIAATFAGAGKPLRATNVSRTGDQEATIADRLRQIKDQILSGDNSCSKWLTGVGISASDFISAILGASPADYTFGHADLNDNTTAALVGTRNASDGSAIFADDVVAPSITVNNNGAFFSDAYTVGSQKYAGGSIAAQIFILIHELAHQVGAKGFNPDAGLPDVGKSNDGLIDKNCGKQISGVK